MRARIICTTTGRTIYATVESVLDKTDIKLQWKSDEGAFLGPVGGLPDCYEIKNIIEERRKE